MKYLKGALDVGLWYPEGAKISFVGYSYSDFA